MEEKLIGENKYSEREFIDELVSFIEKTYDSHYAHKKGIQLIDSFHAQGDGVAYCRTNAQKYVARYGKKKGYNKEDLFKAIHCIMIMSYFIEDDETNEN